MWIILGTRQYVSLEIFSPPHAVYYRLKDDESAPWVKFRSGRPDLFDVFCSEADKKKAWMSCCQLHQPDYRVVVWPTVFDNGEVDPYAVREGE